MKQEKTTQTKSVLQTVPRYIINLDDPPETRWDQVIEDYKDQWIKIQSLLKNELKDSLGKFVGGLVDNVVSFVLSAANSFGAVYYGRELKAMSSKSGMKLGRLVALQLVYELFSCCTSIIVPGADGVPIHMLVSFLFFLKD
jgi:predicted PurR-regulated permease PerM